MPRCNALLGLAAAAALAVPAAAQTADEVIARSIEARGGLAKIKAVQSLRMIGKMTMGPMEMPMTVEMKRPSSFRAEMSFQGQPVVQAFDGQQAWTISPAGNGQPEALPAEAARQMEQQADIEGALVDYKAKGHQAELVGRDKLDGADAYRIKLTHKGGDVEYYLIDAKSWLPVRIEATRRLGENWIEGETAIGGYEDAGGWKWPHSIVNGAKGQPEKQTLSFDTVDVNPVLDDSRFRMPVAKPKAPPQ
jgi:outer membrane lipoprotein-sorting protein